MLTWGISFVIRLFVDGDGTCFRMGLYQFEEGGHRRGNPLVLVPQNECAHVQRWPGPVQRLAQFLAHLARGRDVREQGETHPCTYALLHGFKAGKFRYIAGADALHCEYPLKPVSIAAANLGEQEALSGKIGRLDGAALYKRMIRFTVQRDFFSVQANRAVSLALWVFAHINHDVDFAGFQVDGRRQIGWLRAKAKLDIGEASAKGAQHRRQAIRELALRRVDAQRPAGFGSVANGALAALHRFERLLRKWAEALPGICEHDAAPKTIEKRRPEFFLQRFNLSGDVGLDSVYFLGCAREVEFFGESAEDLQLTNFHDAISNCDAIYHINQLDRYKVREETRSMRVELPRRPLRPGIFLIVALIASWFVTERAFAEMPAATTSHTTTLILFATHSMPEGEWTALLAALRKGAVHVAAEAPALRGAFEILRGDKIAKGLHVDKPIAVYLHGDCTLLPRPVYVRAGTLGWVLRSKERIEPFIHVNCAGLVDMLGPLALAMSVNRRNMVMAEAITRVILHEWIHIATQNAGHAAHGVAQPQFSVFDLLADDEELRRFRAIRVKKSKKG